MRRAHYRILFLFLVAACSVAAQSTAPGAQGGELEAKVDAYVKPYLESKNFSGSVLIARGGKVLVNKGYGMANLELGVPNTPQTRFHIASVSKPFTAAAILLLEERGKLSVQDPVSKYVPDFPEGGRILLHHLLTHTSGIPNINNFPEYQTLSQSPQTPAQLVEVFKKRALDFPPGQKYAYSNSNYNLLAFIIEKVSGQSYGDFLQANIFAPLGMTSTLHDGAVAELIPHRASGYVPAGFDGLENAPFLDWSSKTGNGSLVTTVEDLFRWDRALYTDKLLSAASRAKMFTDHGSGAGYGWFVRQNLGHNVTASNGRSPGFTASVERYVEDDVCVILTANTYSSISQAMASDLAAIVLGEEKQIHPLAAAQVAPALLQAYAGRYKFGPDFRFNPGLEVSVELSDGHLVMRGGGDSFLLPQSESEFLDRLYGGRVTFTRDAAGKIAHLKWNFGRDYVAERVASR